VPAQGREREIWDGYRVGPEAAPATLGVDAAQSVEALDSAMPELPPITPPSGFPSASIQGWSRIDEWLAVCVRAAPGRRGAGHAA
jgi:Xaa-Pro aminopeptidase